jgi:hypothetical protein
MKRRKQNMKWAIVALMALGTAEAAMAQGPCRGTQVEGIWKNPFGERFEIIPQDCDRIIVREIDWRSRYHVVDVRGEVATPLEFGGLTFTLRISPPSTPSTAQLSESGVLLWKIGRGRQDVSPGFGIQVNVWGGEWNVPGRIDVLYPSIQKFVYEEGKVGGLFDRGMQLAVDLLNHFKVAQKLSQGFQKANTLERVRN